MNLYIVLGKSKAYILRHEESKPHIYNYPQSELLPLLFYDYLKPQLDNITDIYYLEHYNIPSIRYGIVYGNLEAVLYFSLRDYPQLSIHKVTINEIQKFYRKKLKTLVSIFYDGRNLLSNKYCLLLRRYVKDVSR